MRKKGIEVGKPIQIFIPEINYRKNVTRKELMEVYGMEKSHVSKSLTQRSMVKSIGGYIIYADTPKKETNKIYKELEIKGEEWKRYKNTTYAISNYGRVKNIKNNRIRCATVMHRAIFIRMFDNGINYCVSLSRAVYELFVGEIPPNMCVSHINLNYIDCRESNLMLSSRSKITALSNSLNSTKKVKRSDGKIYYSITEASEEVFTTPANISKALKEQWRTAGGYKWFYV